MTPKEAPYHLSRVHLPGLLSDQSLRQMIHPAWPHMSLPLDSIENHLGTTAASRVRNLPDPILIADAIWLHLAAVQLHPLQHRLLHRRHHVSPSPRRPRRSSI